MKLARYLAEIGTEQTHADLLEALPFYKGGIGHRTDLLSIATAWGYRQHIMLKKTFIDGIEFFSGETLQETSLDAMSVSYSQDFAHDYEPDVIPFEHLHGLTQIKDYHWSNHTFQDKHRNEDNAIPGFNMVVLDIDGGADIDAVHKLLGEYTFMTYTTKRHQQTPGEDRFRLIMPTNYVLNLDQEDYTQFMANIVEWLPFPVDKEANQRSRKWMTNPKGAYHYNMGGMLLDVLPFVPKTKKNELYDKSKKELASLDSLERWFAQRIADGNRNNQMLKFAMVLVDAGMQYAEVEQKVTAFNSRLSNKLTDDELQKTILVTVAKKLANTP